MDCSTGDVGQAPSAAFIFRTGLLRGSGGPACLPGPKTGSTSLLYLQGSREQPEQPGLRNLIYTICHISAQTIFHSLLLSIRSALDSKGRAIGDDENVEIAGYPALPSPSACSPSACFSVFFPTFRYSPIFARDRGSQARLPSQVKTPLEKTSETHAVVKP